MNKIHITGNIARDVELKTTKSGISRCTLLVAVNRRMKKEDGQNTDFFWVETFRELADVCSKYLEKGKKVGVSGTMHLDEADVDGKHTVYPKIIAEEVDFLSPKNATQTVAQGGNTAPTKTEGYSVVTEDELPF